MICGFFVCYSWEDGKSGSPKVFRGSCLSDFPTFRTFLFLGNLIAWQ